jgi:[protein-PII] uridylyltransferase
MPQVDPELFDRGQFQAELALKASPIAAFKKAIRQAREVLDGRFRSGRDIRRLIEDRAWFVDNILQKAWEQFTGAKTPTSPWLRSAAMVGANCTPTPTSTC